MTMPTFAQLDALVIRLGLMAEETQGSADALAKVPNGDPSKARQQARDLASAAWCIRWMAGRADRLDLLNERVKYPNRHKGGGLG